MELHVYDFDGTLFHSPAPPASWSNKGGWWSDDISLSEPCVPERPGGGWWNEATVSAAKASISDPNVYAILCTGRQVQSFARYRVPELLRLRGLDFDRVYLKPGGGDTAAFKKAVILKILRQYPVTAVHIYEDRENHLSEFCQMVQRLGIDCVPHPVRSPEPVCETAVQRLAAKYIRENSMKFANSIDMRRAWDYSNQDFDAAQSVAAMLTDLDRKNNVPGTPAHGYSLENFKLAQKVTRQLHLESGTTDFHTPTGWAKVLKAVEALKRHP